MKAGRLARARIAGTLAVLVWAASAPAQPSAADRDTARTLMDEGDAKLAARDVAAARKAYQAAHDIMNVPVTGVALARAQAASGMLVEGRETCLAVEHLPSSASEPGPFKKARAECTALVAQIEPRIPSLRIALAGLPADDNGAAPKVSIDGVALAKGAWLVPRKVNPGKHAVSASATGYSTVTSDVDVPEGATKDVSLTLAKVAVAPPATTAPAPVVPAPSPPPPARDAGEKAPTSPLVYVGFGVGAAGLAVGSLTGIFALAKASKAKEGCVDTVCPRGNQNDLDSSRSFGTISTVAFVIGGAGLVVGGVGLAVGGKRESTAASLRVSAGLGGVAVDGAFLGSMASRFATRW